MDFLQEFRAPERRFSVAAFWFWNGELKSQRLLWQMDQMAEKGVYNAFMHARAYLVTPYLGEEWFSVVGDCVRHAKEIGFYPWLYDEYAWPSGTAGSTFECCDQAPSRVLAKGERNMAKGLDVWQKELVGPGAPGCGAGVRPGTAGGVYRARGVGSSAFRARCFRWKRATRPGRWPFSCACMKKRWII